MKLILVRHGQTDEPDRYWGATDTELTAVGRAQAEKLRERLAGEKIGAIYSSCLKRAADTADVIASGRGLDVVRCPEINEVDFGSIEGLTYSQICRLHPDVAVRWAKKDGRVEFPGGENFGSFNERVARFLERLEGHATEDTIVVVCHGGPVRLLLCHLLGIDLGHFSQFNIGLASLSVVETYPEGAVLCKLADDCHLVVGETAS